MSQYTPVDFIAPNVAVEILYGMESSDDCEEWTKCIIKSVKKRGAFGNGSKFVFCEIQMLDNTHVVVNETLHDSDYECDSHFAWRFSYAFKPLVEQLMKVTELDKETDYTDNAINDPEYEPSEESDEEVDDDETSNFSETDEYEDKDDNESSESESDYNIVYVKRYPSLTNRVFATLFMLSPWFASLAVVYNARYDIFKHLQNKYC
jgi:hypothetical protein